MQKANLAAVLIFKRDKTPVAAQRGAKGKPSQSPAMKELVPHILSRKLRMESRKRSTARFQNTDGLPPEGVKLLGRWTRADLSGGFAILETDDAKRLLEFAYMWGDLMDLQIFPVVDDQELSTALESARR